MKQDLLKEVSVPEGVTMTLAGNTLTVKGPKGELTRDLPSSFQASVVEGSLKLEAKQATKREKKLLFTYRAHVANMVKGVQEPFVYKLKVCSSHFPITAAISGKEFSVKNFLGEKVPRKITLRGDVKVTISGAEITVEANDIETAGTAAAAIEGLTRVTDKDRRIFQDGIFIYEKAGRKVSG